MDKEILQQAALLHPHEIMHPYDEIIGIAGFEAICAFAEHLGGLTVYVPSVRTIFARCLEEEARKHFTGNNYASLSKKYGFSERHIRRALGGK